MLENSPALWLDQLPRPNAKSNKYSRGYALIYGGYPVTGAARLAALACARSGAGLTALAVSEKAFPIYASSMLSIMVKPYANDEALDLLINDQRIAAYLIGPGAGVNEKTKKYAIAMLANKKPAVVDADAISVFNDDAQGLSTAVKGQCVLTPHEGEFARVFGEIADRSQAALHAASMTGAVMVLKGHETIIASPSGELIINKNAPSNLATAGSGDVLAGIITGFLAQEMPAFLAAAAGAWVHGECAKMFGVGLIAEDLPGMLPQVLNRMIG